MVVFPNAKINIGLNITAKREDGYHDLVTCFYPIGWTDILEVIEAPKGKTSFESSGLPIEGDPKQNLVMKAYEMLRKDFNLPPVSIYLHKLIPMGAGLGGGSSDAAFMLKALNELFQLYLSDGLLEDYAARLGADCAFFIRNKPTLAFERGDVFASIDLQLEGKHIVVLKPEDAVNTAEAYAGVTPKLPETNLKQLLEELPITEWKNQVQNDFEQSIFPKHPAIEALKVHMYARGAQYASMSGSGSAVFGIFKEEPQLQAGPEVKLWHGKL